ncbi:hypothetical protein CR194_01970 [Salipaludibacillus keqinensis]|uniref:Competence protein ComG n=1 Tax=Salipaludibacillus keqinensis TaxID=2045207 RepID=A0A323TGS6_9BACI|nr:competence type IV pilus minor pilin ComGD [Salipaludibacillus keqinensis]PYZ94322.1 hypothetical protein CR194_01970 [Salipaludibacillus keqinensis]
MIELKSLRTSEGFSLIELVIVLFLISIILLIAIPSVNHQMTKMETAYFLKELEHDLYYYQMYAMSNGRSVRFVFSATSPRYTVVEGVRTIHHKEGPDGIRFSRSTLSLNELRFLGTGGVQKAGKIEIYTKDENYQLIFHLVRGRFYFAEL